MYLASVLLNTSAWKLHCGCAGVVFEPLICTLSYNFVDILLMNSSPYLYGWLPGSHIDKSILWKLHLPQLLPPCLELTQSQHILWMRWSLFETHLFPASKVLQCRKRSMWICWFGNEHLGSGWSSTVFSNLAFFGTWHLRHSVICLFRSSSMSRQK